MTRRVLDHGARGDARTVAGHPGRGNGVTTMALIDHGHDGDGRCIVIGDDGHVKTLMGDPACAPAPELDGDQIGAIFNVSNPAAYGAEWRGESGTRYQLVNAIGSELLTFGALPADAGGHWISSVVAMPERFGFTGPCKSGAELMGIAARFVGAR